MTFIPAGSMDVERTRRKARPSSIELRHLRYFLAAVDQGSFRRAALRLGARQSSVSRRIRELEVLLGIPLFDRRPSGARPTEAGQRFGCHARQIVLALDAAVWATVSWSANTEGMRSGSIEAAS